MWQSSEYSTCVFLQLYHVMEMAINYLLASMSDVRFPNQDDGHGKTVHRLNPCNMLTPQPNPTKSSHVTCRAFARPEFLLATFPKIWNF
jgi:hypothetical protein